MKKFTLILALAGASFIGAIAQGNVVQPNVQSKLYSDRMMQSPIRDNVIVPKTYNNAQEEKTAQVTFVTTHDPNEFLSMDLLVYNSDFTDWYWNLDYNVANTFVATIPHGTYDMLLAYTDYWTLTQEYINIKELVVIDKDTTIEFSTDDINKRIKFRPSDRNGNEFVASVVTWASDENGEWYYETVSEGNINSACIRRTIALDGYGEVRAQGYSMSGGLFQGSLSLNDQLDFFISDVSDRYTLLRSNAIVDTNNDVYFSKMRYNVAGGTDSISSIPDNYKLYTRDFNLETSENSTDVYVGGYVTYEFFNNQPTNGYNAIGAIELTDGKTSINYYIDAPASDNDDSIRYDVLISPSMGIGEVDAQGLQTVFPTIGMPVAYENNDFNHKYIVNDFYNYLPVVPSNDLEVVPFYPGIEEFAYTFDDFEMSNYSTTPIVSFYSKHNEMQELYFEWNAAYIDRLGNQRRTDWRDVDIELTYNGTEYEMTDYGVFLQFPSKVYNDKLDAGILELTMTAPNKVDGINGYNKIKVYNNLTQKDFLAPTMRMLQFRNNEGKVTERFQRAADGRMMFTAGDFVFCWNTEVYQYEYHCEPITMEVSYAPTGTDTWETLEVELVNELSSSNFGYFYETSLQDVVTPSEEGWFDLRFKLTDASGNTQEQIVSPAFRIEELASVSNVTVDDSGIYDVYDISGRTVATGTAIDNDMLQEGIYIVRDVVSGECRKVVVK